METSKEKLERLLTMDLEEEIEIAIQTVGDDEFLLGFAIERAASYIYKSYIDCATLTAIKYDITKDEVVAVIKNTTNKIRIKYLDNPTLIP